MAASLRKMTDKSILAAARRVPANRHSDKWILHHHDAWSRATLSRTIGNLSSGSLEPALFAQWLLDRAIIANALARACARVQTALGNTLHLPALQVANEEADWLTNYATARGIPVLLLLANESSAFSSSSSSPSPSSPSSSSSLLSYEARRLIDAINVSTVDSESICASLTAVWCFLMVSWQACSLSRRHHHHHHHLQQPATATAIIPPHHAASPNPSQQTAAVAEELLESGLAAGLAPADPTVKEAVAQELRGSSSVGVYDDHLELRNFLSRDATLVRLVETQSLLDSLLNVSTTQPVEVTKAQKTFQDILSHAVSTLDRDVDDDVFSTGRAPLCSKCGRKGHTEDLCAFKSHV